MKKIILMTILLLNFVFVQNLAFSQEQDIYSLAYMNRLQNKVKSNWILPHAQEGKKTVVVFDIDKNGNVSNSFISESSGDKEFDEVALSAISKSAPFENLSQDLNDEYIKINFVFSQNLFEATQIAGEKQFCETVQKTYEKNPTSLQDNNLSTQNDSKSKSSVNRIAKTADFTSYLRDLQKDIRTNWSSPIFNNRKKAVVSFSIDKEGELSNLEIDKSSGDKNYDKKALEAVSQTAPFAPLPSSFNASSIDIRLTFNYSFSHNRSNLQVTNLMFNNYYIVPPDFSSPVTRFWAVDKVFWWSFIVLKICNPGI